MHSFQQHYRWYIYRVTMFLLILFFLSGCNSSRFAQVNFPYLLSQPRDFPAQLQAAPPQSLPDSIVRNGIGYIQNLKTTQRTSAGEVQLYLFYNLNDQNTTYDYFTLVESQEGIVPYETPAVGENRAAHQTDNSITLVFRRCSSVAVITLYDAAPYKLNGKDVTNYAERLDKRLQPIACQ